MRLTSFSISSSAQASLPPSCDADVLGTGGIPLLPSRAGDVEVAKPWRHMSGGIEGAKLNTIRSER